MSILGVIGVQVRNREEAQQLFEKQLVGVWETGCYLGVLRIRQMWLEVFMPSRVFVAVRGLGLVALGLYLNRVAYPLTEVLIAVGLGMFLGAIAVRIERGK